MKLVFLGTSAALPTAERGLACTCIERDGEILIFDAGEGAQMAFSRARLGWNKPTRVFITHMHGDHCIGVLGLVQTMSLYGRSEPLEVYGPRGIDEFLAFNMRALGVLPAFPLSVNTVSAGVVAESDSYKILACTAHHRVEAYSYVLAENERPGRFHEERAISLGIPKGTMWHDLQSGNEITVGGRTIRPSQVMDAPRPGLRVGISGDTRPTPELEAFFGGCDWLIFESTFSHALHEKARETLHTTAREAGELATRAHAKNLVLTHFSARHADESALVAEARHAHGSVMGAHDGMEIEI